MNDSQTDTDRLVKVDILGTRLDCGPLTTVVDAISDLVGLSDPSYVCVGNVHTVMEARSDVELAAALRESAVVTTDGMPLVWSAHAAGHKATERAYGPDLVEALIARGLADGWTHFFLGGGPGIAEKVASVFGDRHPGFKSVGAVSPPMGGLDDVDYEEVLGEIADADPDVVWVGLGMPKQEKWMARYVRDSGSSAVFIGVGAAFDFFAGEVRQAPRFVQRSGFEWLFRLAMEPRRLAHRYLITCAPFLYRVARDRPEILDDRSCEKSRRS